MKSELETCLSVAYGICRLVHHGQYDKAGQPYYLHPYHVANQCCYTNNDISRVVVGLLHDTVEDHPEKISIDFIKTIFGENIACAVDAMTRREGEKYKDYLERVKKNPIAREVKIEDIKHNLDLSRFPDGADVSCVPIKRYKKALEYLNE